MVLEHVAQHAGLLVEAGAMADADRFRHGDLDVVDVPVVPERLEDRRWRSAGRRCSGRSPCRGSGRSGRSASRGTRAGALRSSAARTRDRGRTASRRRRAPSRCRPWRDPPLREPSRSSRRPRGAWRSRRCGCAGRPRRRLDLLQPLLELPVERPVGEVARDVLDDVREVAGAALRGGRELARAARHVRRGNPRSRTRSVPRRGSRSRPREPRRESGGRSPGRAAGASGLPTRRRSRECRAGGWPLRFAARGSFRTPGLKPPSSRAPSCSIVFIRLSKESENFLTPSSSSSR